MHPSERFLFLNYHYKATVFFLRTANLHLSANELLLSEIYRIGRALNPLIKREQKLSYRIVIPLLNAIEPKGITRVMIGLEKVRVSS